MIARIVTSSLHATEVQAHDVESAEPRADGSRIFRKSGKRPQGHDVWSLGFTLRFLRGGRSLREIQEATDITYSYLSDIERGNKRPGENVLSRLSEYYNVPLGELLEMAGSD